MKSILLAALLAASALIADTRVEPARILKRTNLDTRDISAAARIDGAVKLEISLGQQGQINKIRIVEGRPDLLAAAIRTVRQWDYSSAYVDGRPVPGRLMVELNFHFTK